MSDIRTDLSWLSTLLRASTARHRAVSSNLANAKTPGYRPVHVEFEEQLREVLSESGEGTAERIASLEPRVVRDDSGRELVVEQEVMDLMKNQLAFDTYAQVVSMKIGILRAAITSGGK
jgi:flagellar basal body rod protein FlgB